MTLPLVSVIIPNYNHAVFLRQRIDSVLHQTYKNLEVIILDDGSSDNSRDIIQEYVNKPNVRHVVFNDVNSGSPFKQWQRGVSLAKGDWIWFAESDDYAELEFLKKMVAAVDGKKNVGLVYCDSLVLSNNNALGGSFAQIKNQRFQTDRWSKDHTNSGLDEIENYLLPGGTINNASAVLFNARILREASPFDPDLKYIGDKLAYIKVLAHANVSYVKEPLNHYRDPFNTKHANKLLYYFYEQFIVFNWVYLNLEISKSKFFDAFYANTRTSLFRDWNKIKFAMFKELFQLNRHLLVRSLSRNFLYALRSVFR